MNAPISDIVAAKENTRNVRLDNSQGHGVKQRRAVGRNDGDFKVGDCIMREGTSSYTY